MRDSFHLLYGRGTVDVPVEADLIAPPQAVPLADETAAIEGALERPIGSKPLRDTVQPGEKVVIVVNDVTRLARTDLMLPPLVKCLNQAGIPDRDILVVFALGTHRPHTEEEKRLILGEEMYRRLPMLDHDCHGGLVTLGKTTLGNLIEINRQVWDADRIILTGEIIYHRIAGYSGGRKSIMPGVAGYRSAVFNHQMIFDPRCESGVLDGNPAHEDMLEACRMVEPDFILNVILSPAGRLLHVVAGHYEVAHREGCRAADRLLRTEIEQPYDVVIASAGGHPLDIDLRQAHKGLENARKALRPGGTLFYYAECTGGTGAASLEEYLYRYNDEHEMEQALRREFALGGHKAYWLAQLGRNYDVHFVSQLDPRLIERCRFRPVDPERHLDHLRDALRRAGASARIAVLPHAGFTVPAVRSQIPDGSSAPAPAAR